MLKTTIIAGARPNFMKISPIIKAIEAKASKKITYRLVHTGQHYDKNMSGRSLMSLVSRNPYAPATGI